MRRRISNTILGLIFVIIGIGFAGDVMNLWTFNLFFKGWWTMLIIIPCFLSIIRGDISVGPITGLIIGVMLLVSHYVSLNFNIWKLIIPIILIVIGLRIILQGTYRRSKHIDYTVHVEGHTDYDGNKKEYTAVFSSNNIRVTDQFTGAVLNSVFGGLVLDLRDAVIDSDVEINATAVFGGIDIYVPRNVQIKINNVPIFGGVSNKTGVSSDPGAHTIYLTSTTMFGGIDIK